jgi:hypothetical protein
VTPDTQTTLLSATACHAGWSTDAGYPRAGPEGSVTILTLLLAGYAAALLGASCADRHPGEGTAGQA